MGRFFSFPSTSFWYAAFILLLPSTMVDAFVTISPNDRSDNSFTLALDSVLTPDGSFFTAGLQQPQLPTTSLNQDDTPTSGCYVGFGTLQSFEQSTNVLFETLCLGIQVFPISSGATGFGNTEEIGMALLGMKDTQAYVTRMFPSNEEGDVFFFEKIELDHDYFPVAWSGDANGGLYVGLHNTNGLILPTVDAGHTETGVTSARIAVSKILSYFTNFLDVSATSTDALSGENHPALIKIDIHTGEQKWSSKFETVNGRSAISAIEHVPYLNDALIIAGSSSGKGWWIGEQAETSTGSWDGFLTKVSAEDGGINESLRISSQALKNEYVQGICVYDNHVYVLGSTDGKLVGTIDGGAFVMKVDVETFDIVWTQQIYLGNEATHCVATNELVYVVGHVPQVLMSDGGSAATTKTRASFATRMDPGAGSTVWSQVIDSHHHDYLSGVMIDKEGDMIMTGNAIDIEFGRSKVWLISLAKEDGAHDWSGLTAGTDPIGFGPGVASPTNEGTTPGTTDTNEGTTTGSAPDTGGSSGGSSNGGSTNTGSTSGTSSGSSSSIGRKDDSGKKATILVSAIVPCVVLLLVIMYTVISAKKPRLPTKKTTESPAAAEQAAVEPPQVASNDEGQDRQVV